MLFAPADNAKYIEKALMSAADAVVFDLEDGTPPSRKAAARELLTRYLDSGAVKAKPAFIRTGRVDSPELTEDIAVGMHEDIDGFIIPKTDAEDDVMFADRLVSLIEKSRGFPAGRFRLIPMVETAAGVMNLSGIAGASARSVALCFGAYDYKNDLKVMADPPDIFHAVPKALLAAAARSAGLLPIDTPHFIIDDEDGLRAEKEEAFALGFAGSLVITPRHLDIVNECFTPSAAALRKSLDILDALKAAERAGAAYATYDGAMIDAPVRELAGYIASYAEATGSSRHE
jgi:citrate lyase subunit beta/citryl-CoA lyase